MTPSLANHQGKSHFRAPLIQAKKYRLVDLLQAAKQSLKTAGLPEDSYLTVFGQYILPPEVFAILEKNCGEKPTSRLELTSALDELCRSSDGLHALVVKGERFDFGDPASLLHTSANFAS